MKKLKKKSKKKLKERCNYNYHVANNTLVACDRRATVSFACITCEKLGTQFVVFACGEHARSQQAKIRNHALRAHPMNMLGATLAALAGEDVFED